MSDQAESTLHEWVKQALDLRYGTGKGGEYLDPSNGPSAVLNGLLGVRARLDRIEELLSRVVRLRGRASRQVAVAKAVAEDAWDEQVQKERAKTSRQGEFEAPRERYANANLETLQQKRDLRQAERFASQVDEAYSVIQLVHRGLDGVRQDHLTVLRTLNWESHMERSGTDRGY